MNKSKRLKIISSINVPTPCHESWNEMQGDQRRRFCDKCTHSVTNLSEFSEADAAQIIAKRGTQRLCVRYLATPAGEIIFKNSPTQRSKLLHFSSAFLAALMTWVGLAPLKAVADSDCEKPAQEQVRREQLGEMAAREDLGLLVAIPESSPSPVASSNVTPSPTPEHTMGIIAPTQEVKGKMMLRKE